MSNIFKSFTITTGKIIFVVGLILNIGMVWFGIWPSLLYLIIMLFGAEIVYITGKGERINLNYASVKKLIYVTAISLLMITLLAIVILFSADNYFKKRDTLNECKEIVIGLDQYKISTNNYPINLSALIEGNPLRTGWTKDEWGKFYQYNVINNGKSYILTSAGADLIFGTKDDLMLEGINE